ncbi:TPA: C40 family peptidase [Enterobacter cancerogenus]|uniref:C40 family peptidase n=1 Tax=Enterobacter sp. TaxID=42895 RepID=UPI003304F83A|nr:C40 family peptidase [Enterobacter cancerogenus]HDR2165757.1 C40 family peptidase [Enterobacter cancerogenus]HDR2266362.1 C40 family peptidase [Enterobacter cancerogenus]
MARITKISITLCALLFTSLAFTPAANASQQVRHSAVQKTHLAKNTERKKKTTSKTEKKKTTATTKRTTSSKAKVARITPSSTRKVQKTAANLVSEKCTVRKGRKTKCVKGMKIAEVHKVRVQKAQKTALNKLMGQIGKPYRWGGTSPRTGFDCSGLVYYAYKDLVKFRIPRTANEMYHLRDASPVNRGELENGDLVFFRTQGRGTADHVGVYVGNGKFIQSPRSGQDIQITSLSEDYWVRHYVGARRVMTPQTIR